MLPPRAGINRVSFDTIRRRDLHPARPVRIRNKFIQVFGERFCMKPFPLLPPTISVALSEVIHRDAPENTSGQIYADRKPRYFFHVISPAFAKHLYLITAAIQSFPSFGDGTAVR